VIIAGRRQARLDEITAAHPGMRGLPLDAGDPRSVDAFARDVQQRFPELNVLINNAGISQTEDFTGGMPELSVTRSIIQTNIVGVLHLTAALLPTLEQQQASTIITTTSGLASCPSPVTPPTASARPFCTPGCSRCALSSGKRPSRCSSWLARPVFRERRWRVGRGGASWLRTRLGPV
jgi:uncharacterized oxidoreductase